MTNRKTLATSAVASLIALGIAGAASYAQSGPAANPGKGFEKCYGLVKAGKNDCQTSNSACAGTAKSDGQPDSWVYLPKGTCDKLVMGSSKPKV